MEKADGVGGVEVAAACGRDREVGALSGAPAPMRGDGRRTRVAVGGRHVGPSEAVGGVRTSCGAAKGEKADGLAAFVACSPHRAAATTTRNRRAVAAARPALMTRTSEASP